MKLHTLIDISRNWKNARKNARILSEFPWLWAVKNEWDLSREHIVVEGLHRLQTLLVREPNGTEEVWVLTDRDSLLEMVEIGEKMIAMVQMMGMANRSWAKNITLVSDMEAVCGIVHVDHDSVVGEEEIEETITVFRQKKPGQLDTIINKVLEDKALGW